MNIVIEPALSKNFQIHQTSSSDLLISDGIRGVELSFESNVDTNVLALLQESKSDSKVFKQFLQAHSLDLEETVEMLLPFGCISESENVIEKHGYNAAYLAHKLIYFYRVKSQSAWKNNPTLNTLYGKEACKTLALGFLFETFHHVKGAKWTSVPVLAHRMKAKQRDILEKFYLEERNHYKYIAKAFEQQGISTELILNSKPNTETELLERHFYSCANMSVLDFSAAIIVPEVGEYESISAGSKDLFENMVDVHGIHPEFIKSFKMHGDDHVSGGHDSMPFELIALEGMISKEKAGELLLTVDHTVNAYSLFLEGVYKKYGTSFKVEVGVDFKI